MDLNKYLGAFRNRKEILEGIKNRIFKKEHIEAEAKKRFDICRGCDSLDEKGGDCIVLGTQPCCKECGCSLPIKTRSLASECPLDKWKALMDEDTEEVLMMHIKNEEE